MSEDSKNVDVADCPRIGLVAEIVRNNGKNLDKGLLFKEDVGGHVGPDLPSLVVSQHLVTTEFGQGECQIAETMMALYELKCPR
ncbi:hypothetical protein DFAR_150017 [Desulfarculales bacterium]